MREVVAENQKSPAARRQRPENRAPFQDVSETKGVNDEQQKFIRILYHLKKQVIEFRQAILEKRGGEK